MSTQQTSILTPCKKCKDYIYFNAWRGPVALRKYLSMFHFCHLPTNLLFKSLYILLGAATMAPHQPVNLQITRLLCGFILEPLAPGTTDGTTFCCCLLPEYQDLLSEEVSSFLSELRLILGCDLSPDATSFG